MSIQYRDILYKNHKMTDPNTLEFEIEKTNLATYNTILKRAIRLAKRSHYEALFTKFKNDISSILFLLTLVPISLHKLICQ